MAFDRIGDIEFGYGSRYGEKKAGLAFQVRVADRQRPSLDFLAESRLTAKRIRTSFSGESLWLALSGGIDSECMARAFLEEGIPFRAAICKFKGDLNLHDIRYAVRFCESHDIPYSFFELDVLAFLRSGEHLQYASDFHCHSPQIACHLWLAQKIPGAFVFAGTPLQWAREPVSPFFRWLHPPSENQFCLENLISRKKLAGVAQFFFSDRHLIFSGLRKPSGFFEKKLHMAYSASASTFECSHTLLYRENFFDWLERFHFYRESGFDLAPRPTKYTGFERIHYLEGGGSAGRAFEKQDLDTQFQGLLRFNERYRNPAEELDPPAPAYILSLPSEQWAPILGEARGRGDESKMG